MGANAERKLRLGIIGLGRAFTLMRPGFMASPQISLVAAADPRPEARARFIAEFGGRAHEDVDALLRDACFDAVYIASHINSTPLRRSLPRRRASTCWWKSRWH